MQLDLTDHFTEMYAKFVLVLQHSTESGECKVLDVLWNASDDTLVFDMSELAQLSTCLPPTKKYLICWKNI